MVFFPNEIIELWEYNEDKNNTNFFGEPEPYYNLIGEYPCDFQNLSPSDSQQEFGKILTDAYKMYLDINVPITDTMIVRVKGHSETYHIKGSPLIYNHILPHIKVLLEKERQSRELK